MFPDDHIPASIPVLKDLFLAGACVDDGVLAAADRSYVRAAAKVMRDLRLPVSPPLDAVAKDTCDSDEIINGLPYRFANLAKRYGEVDYLELPPQDHDILILCNIPADNHAIFDTISSNNLEAQLTYLRYTRVQQTLGVEDSHKLSGRHSAKEWAQKIEQDRPYIVAIMGSADNFHAREIAGEHYIALTGPGFSQGILIDRAYLDDLQQPLAAAPLGPERRLPALVSLSLETQKHPSRRSYEWDYAQRRFLPEMASYSHFRP